MTIIELFDNAPINNIIGALTLRPDKIIYIGSFSANTFNGKKNPILRKYLDRKGLNSTVIEYVHIRRDSLINIVDTLEEIYAENTDCRFNVEITGGEDLTLVAIGVLCQRHPELQFLRINSRTHKITSYSLLQSEEPVKSHVQFYNTVEDNIILHEAEIINSNGSDSLECAEWQFTEDFTAALGILWEISCRGIADVDYTEYYPDYSYPNVWNRVTTTLMLFENFCETDCLFKIPEDRFRSLTEKYCDFDLFNLYLRTFMDENIITVYSEDGYIYIQFENEQLKNCLTKSGSVLELKTYLACREMLNGNNGDVRTGVTIYWGNENSCSQYDANTINEVDVMATHGVVPYFISCKNGKFSADELYKLYSVGERFGTGYSVKIVVTADINFALKEQKELILHRAADMGVKIIPNVHLMTDAEFKEALMKAMDLSAKAIATQ